MYWGTSRFRAVLNALLRGPGRCEIIVRVRGRVAFIPLSRAGQFALVFAIGAIGAWVGHASFSYFDQRRVIEGKDLEITQAGEHNQKLLAKMSEMRSQFSDVAGTLDRNHRDLVNLLKQNDALKRQLGDVEQNLYTSENKRVEGNRTQTKLSAHLGRIESEKQQVDNRNKRLAGDLSSTRTKLIDSIAERSRVDTARRSLEDQAKGLKRQLAELRKNQQSLFKRVTAKAVRDLKRAERVIAQTGLNVRKLLRRSNGDAYAQGGPFIPATPLASRGYADSVVLFDRHVERLRQVRGLLRRLPLAKPVGKYRVSSRFGRRRDPINKKWARHDGVDLSGKLRTPVLATAPGKIIYAGWKGRYGRLVLIDHGLGIRTRYGHMRQINVKRGQIVKAGDMIGQLGNSGRSTGPHLHYEILVDKKPVNPIKFIKAGKDVYKE